MKHSTFKLLSYLISIGLTLSVFYFGLPLWSLLLVLPAGAYLQIYASNQFSFRPSIALEPIPEKGYEQRLLTFGANEGALEDLGFVRFDEFYLQTSNDVVVFAYMHEERPIVFCQYHHGAKVFYDLETRFENGFSVTTSDLEHSSIAELRAPHLLLQCFPQHSIGELYERHLEAVRFLEQKGFVARKTPLYKFREEFLQEFRESGQRAKGLLAPLKLVKAIYFGNKARFAKSLQEQYLADQLRLP
jgi:hypothetical protein